MKGFINKRDKIKWENTPFEPEFSEEKIAGMIGDSEVIAEAVADAVEAEASTILGEGTDFQQGVQNIAITEIEEADFESLYDVEIDKGERVRGDTIVYNDITEKWNLKHREAWEPVETITADGTVDKIRTSISDTYTGFFIVSNLKAGAADANFGIVFEFDTDPVTRKALGDINGAISSTGQSYINARYEKDGNFWNGYMTSRVAATTSVANRIERLDSYYIEPSTGLSVVTIEIRTTSPGAVLPENSTFTIYGKK